MNGVFVLKKDIIWIFWAVVLFLILSLGFGYFFGRYEQIIVNKSLLQEVPDVQTQSEAECFES